MFVHQFIIKNTFWMLNEGNKMLRIAESVKMCFSVVFVI